MSATDPVPTGAGATAVERGDGLPERRFPSSGIAPAPGERAPQAGQEVAQSLQVRRIVEDVLHGVGTVRRLIQSVVCHERPGQTVLGEIPGHRTAIDGLCLLAPYLGNRMLTGEIANFPTLAGWEPGELAETDEERRIWRYIKERDHGDPPLYLGYGEQDRFAPAHRLLARSLPASAVRMLGMYLARSSLPFQLGMTTVAACGTVGRTGYPLGPSARDPLVAPFRART